MTMSICYCAWRRVCEARCIYIRGGRCRVGIVGLEQEATGWDLYVASRRTDAVGGVVRT